MTQADSQWDKLLKIKTTGRDDSQSDRYRYPYEPTPYPGKAGEQRLYREEAYAP